MSKVRARAEALARNYSIKLFLNHQLKIWKLPKLPRTVSVDPVPALTPDRVEIPVPTSISIPVLACGPLPALRGMAGTRPGVTGGASLDVAPSGCAEVDARS